MRSYNYLLFFVAHDLHRSRRFPSHFTCLSDNMFGLIAGSDIQRIPSATELRRFALAFIHSHSGATGVFRNAFREFVGEATSCLPKTLQTT